MANPFYGVAQKLANRLFPNRNQPAGLAFRFPFQSLSVNEYSSELQLQPAGLEWVTGVFIDNALNPQKFELSFQETGQTIAIPAFSQGLFEVVGLMSDKVGITGRSTGGIDINVRLLNFVPSGANSIWAVTDPGQIVGAVTVNGQVTALPPQGTYAYMQASITSGGVSQTVLGASASRRRLIIGNYASAASQGIATPESIFVGFSIAAGMNAGMEIMPGGVFDSGNGPCHTGTVTVTAATTGHKLYTYQA